MPVRLRVRSIPLTESLTDGSDKSFVRKFCQFPNQLNNLCIFNSHKWWAAMR